MRLEKWFCLSGWSDDCETDEERLDAWEVDDPDQVLDGSLHPDAFCMGVRASESLQLTARATPGKRLDYTLGGGGGVHYLSQRLTEVVRTHAAGDVQLLPVRIDSDTFYIMNVLSIVDCIDEEASRLVRMPGWRPGRRRKYRMVTELRIDPRRAAGHGILMPRYWSVEVVVSEALAAAIGDDYSGVVLDECG